MKLTLPTNEELRIKQLEDGIGLMFKLFIDIRNDWSDPRTECRYGFSIAEELLGTDRTARLREEYYKEER